MTKQDFDLLVVLPSAFLAIGTPPILLLIYFAKRTNTRILQPIAEAFSGRRTFFSWSYIGDYKKYIFKIYFVQGTHGAPNGWALILYLNPKINFDAYIYIKNPGPVLFKKRVQSLPGTENKFYIFSGQPENAKYFMMNENNLNLINEIMQQSFTEGAKQFLSKFLQNRSPFVIKKNQLGANIVVAGGPIKPVDILLIKSCLDKMIILAENLQKVPY